MQNQKKLVILPEYLRDNKGNLPNNLIISGVPSRDKHPAAAGQDDKITNLYRTHIF